jgi:integrase
MSKLWRKQSVKWSLNGKRVPTGTPDAKRERIASKRFYGTLTLATGKTKQQPLTEERKTSETLLRRLQTTEDGKRANGADRYHDDRKRPLTELLADYAAHLRAKRNTERHVVLTMMRIRSLVTTTKAATIGDLDSSKIATTLATWRQREKEPLSVSTSNHYVRAIKGFSRWLWQERRSPDDPLIGLRLLNGKADRKRNRRSLTADELKRLTDATLQNESLNGLTANDRAMLYRVAAYSGLRASELASLTKASFDLTAKTVTVAAAYSKRRRNDTLPLHSSLIGLLTTWLATKDAGVPLWQGTWAKFRCANAARMFRIDLKAAAISYVDDAGRFADFHALRHTFVSQLAKSGVHPSKAKELARHSTITLTMDVYSHVETDELRKSLDTLPPIG